MRFVQNGGFLKTIQNVNAENGSLSLRLCTKGISAPYYKRGALLPDIHEMDKHGAVSTRPKQKLSFMNQGQSTNGVDL